MNIVVLDGHTLNPGDLSWKGIEMQGSSTIYERSRPDEVIERCKNADAIFTNKVFINQQVVEQLPNLKYISVMATGYNVVDLQAAKDNNIIVTNIPAYSTQSVAQQVFAFILHFASKVDVHSKSVQQNGWIQSPDFSYTLAPLTELAGKKIGIWGWGTIGKEVAKIAQAFDLQLLVTSDHSHSIPDVKLVSLETLFSQSDYVTIHKALTPELEEAVNKSLITKMKPTAILINTSRGGIIHEADLADALNSKTLAGAGLDVLSTEPPKADNPLLKAKNCVITPHIAWATWEARSRAMRILEENLASFLRNKPQNVII